MFAMGALAVAGYVAMAVAAGEPSGFERYQVILTRRPFGAPPVEEPGGAKPPVAPPKPVEESFAKNLRMVGIVQSKAGVRVGFVDTGSKPPVNYFLYVGEAQSGITVVDADYEKRGGAALLRKDAEEVWLYMDSAQPGVAAPGGGPATAGSAPAAGRPGSPPGMAPPALPPGATSPEARQRMLSYAERMRQRREILEQRRRSSEEANSGLTPDEFKKRLEEYQMELIRQQGALGPPLPIPLTKEMDDQLVSEGVLPTTP